MKKLFFAMTASLFATFTITVAFGYNNSSPIITAYDSYNSRKMLTISELSDFTRLSQNAEFQINPIFCGIASMVMIINSDNTKKGHVEQGNILNSKTEAVKKRVDIETGSNLGLSLSQLGRILNIYSIKTTIIYASDRTFAQFQSDLIKTITTKNDNSYIIVNFHRKDLGFEHGGGHFSPILAYNKEKDMVLIGDVSRMSNSWFWVDAKILYKGMLHIDDSTGKSRGYVITGR